MEPRCYEDAFVSNIWILEHYSSAYSWLAYQDKFFSVTLQVTIRNRDYSYYNII